MAFLIGVKQNTMMSLKDEMEISKVNLIKVSGTLRFDRGQGGKWG